MAPQGVKSILVVEDEELVRRVLVRKLLREGFVVHEASTAQAALTLLKAAAECPALVISDVILPDMNGRDLIQQIRSHAPEIKVIYMSGYTEDILIERGTLKLGDVFIDKTLILSGLVPYVRKALGL